MSQNKFGFLLAILLSLTFVSCTKEYGKDVTLQVTIPFKQGTIEVFVDHKLSSTQKADSGYTHKVHFLDRKPGDQMKVVITRCDSTKYDTGLCTVIWTAPGMNDQFQHEFDTISNEFASEKIMK